MQIVLNKATRFIHCNEETQMNTEQLHIKYNITPLNISSHQRAHKTWETIRSSESAQYEELITERNKIHSWFPKSSTIIHLEEPEAIITRQPSFSSSFSRSNGCQRGGDHETPSTITDGITAALHTLFLILIPYITYLILTTNTLSCSSYPPYLYLIPYSSSLSEIFPLILTHVLLPPQI